MTKEQARLPAGNGREPSHNGTHAARDQGVDHGAQNVGRSKFDLGSKNGRVPSEDIPWGYGENRVTAMARDPDWLYAYWEMTDEAIDDAVQRLGQAGRDAWCCLRVYDTTGRVFDGTNALSYFDIAIDRTTRDWFVHVGRPQSSCHVEAGIKSRQGDFQPIARSGRADFPRKRPVQDPAIEWLTVQEVDPPAEALPVVAPYVSKYDGPVPEVVASASPVVEVHERRHTQPFPIQVDRHMERRETWRSTWSERRSLAWSTRVSQSFEASYQRRTLPWISGPWRTEWQGDQAAFEWLRPLHRLTWSTVTQTDTWQMAPYPGDSAAPGRVLVRYVGESEATGHASGSSGVVFGPWEVTIHGPAHGSPCRRVIGTWLLHWVQPTRPARARWDLMAERVWFDGFERGGLLPGASDQKLWWQRGASEQWLVGGSEELWLGAGEMLALGASEVLWSGGSEQLLAGASESVSAWSLSWIGASEQRLETGASSWIEKGASEQLVSGASEQWIAGASEQMGFGASEQFAQAASELLIGAYGIGASERVGEAGWVTLGELVGASEWLGASERWGASEQIETLLLGASEQLGADEQQVSPGASDQVPWPPGVAPPGVAPPGVAPLGASEDLPFGASDQPIAGSYPGSVGDELDPEDPGREGGA